MTPSAATPTGCSPRLYLGAAVDLDETYDWGLDQLESHCRRTGVDRPPALSRSLGQPRRCARLDEEPRYLVHGTDALQAWMQELSDRASMRWPTRISRSPSRCAPECRIAPTQTGGIYYTGPSEDLTRPGRMWWSVPPGVDTFHTWQETTTVFHEGVPGHHLQIGRAVVSRRSSSTAGAGLGCWVSGHGEGWALYAERLMAELGWLDDAGNRMGMLDAQRFRAARVVIDIGVHCGMTAPDGGVWDAERAWMFLQSHSAMAEDNLRFELDRYLGWPGQAPSYAIGQRIWQQLRDEWSVAGLPLKEFHRAHWISAGCRWTCSSRRCRRAELIAGHRATCEKPAFIIPRCLWMGFFNA